MKQQTIDGLREFVSERGGHYFMTPAEAADVLALTSEVERLTAANKLLPKLMDALDQYGELRVSQFLVVNSELMAECTAWANNPEVVLFTMTRYARRRDNTQTEITKALEAAGWEVHDLSRVGWGVPDLIIRRTGYKCWVECKSEGETLTRSETRFHAICPGEVITVMSGAQAVEQAEKAYQSYLATLKKIIEREF